MASSPLGLRFGWIVLGCLIGWASPVLAQGAAAPPAPTTQRHEPALQRLAIDLDRGLPALDGLALVAVAPIEGDVAIKRPEALATMIGSLVAGRRTLEAPSEPEPLAAAIARARGARFLIYVRPRIEAGRLTATADVHPVPPTVWARARTPSPGSTAHAFADAALDAEVRRFLAPIPLVSPLAFTRGKNFEPDVLAVVCDDLDRDGSPEIVSMSPDQITVLRLRDGKVAPLATRLWSELSPLDPTPLRQPIGVAFSVERAGDALPAPTDVVVSNSNRAKALRLDTALEVQATYAQFAVPEGGALACLKLPGMAVTGPLVRCAEDAPAPRRASVSGVFDAFAAASLVDDAGARFEVWAGREQGVVELRDERGAFAKIASGGAQLAVGDLNQDGVPEVLTSLDVEPGKPDAVVIYSWDRAGKAAPKEQLRIPIASGVHALAVCPPTSAGRAPFVIASTDEIVVAE